MFPEPPTVLAIRSTFLLFGSILFIVHRYDVFVAYSFSCLLFLSSNHLSHFCFLVLYIWFRWGLPAIKLWHQEGIPKTHRHKNHSCGVVRHRWHHCVICNWCCWQVYRRYCYLPVLHRDNFQRALVRNGFPIREFEIRWIDWSISQTVLSRARDTA